MSKIIAITGSTGFVGRAVVERLLESEDVQLRCLVREGSDTEHLKSLGARVTLVRGDVMEPGTLPLLVDGAWGVINLAGKREFWSPRVQDFYDLNEHAAENVFRAALDAHCEKVIQVSTPLAFGMPEQRPFDETSAPGPHPSDYARSKYLGDQIGWKLHRERGLPLTVVHLAAVIGAGDPRPTMEIRRAVKGGLPALIGADTTFTYLYLQDAAEGIVRALLRESTIGRAYLLGGERATTREYFQMIADHAGGSVPNWNIPEAFILPIAQVMDRVSRWTGLRPPVPLDVIKTTAAGSLLFDTKRAEQELEIHYTPLRQALGEAVDEIRNA
jgi:nucleoside-diphosphate-sugar epimerase